ncbi:MAG TPA: DMT family transporter [Anaerolineales bacterium]|nr:DMT family transporter [Anaerolineales bacterium]
MVPSQVIGILSAVAAAVVWGSADFAGGQAARRHSPLFVLALASLSGLLVLLPAALLTRESIPSWPGIIWSSLAGLSGGLGIAVFYRALSTGPAALVAPSAGVVGAAIPVVVASLTEGFPRVGQVVGLALGLAGIWFVSSGSDHKASPGSNPLPLAIAAGFGFGGFFVFITQVQHGLVFTPLVVAKLSALALGAGLLLASKQPLLGVSPSPVAWLAGILDAGGNIFYVLAAQYARLDIAAVISSMGPGTTVLLARAIQHERMTGLQSIGLVLCLTAVAFIAAG